MRYVIMGTGGVGGYFGAKLATAGEDVWFVARGKHLDAMKNHGLKVTSTGGTFTIPPEKVTGDPASIAFCHRAGLDYVSCSPPRVPIARLAAAQAALRDV